MRALTVLVAAAGALRNGRAPARAARQRRARGAARRLRHERGGRGRFLCDAFAQVPAEPTPASAPQSSASAAEGVDAVLPQSSHDLAGPGGDQDCARRGRDDRPHQLPRDRAPRNDKAECYALLAEAGVPVPAFVRAQGRSAFVAAAKGLGYPERAVCLPVTSSGSRGFRVVDPAVDRTHQLLRERPGSLAMRLEDVAELLPEVGGEEPHHGARARIERTVDGIARGPRVVFGHPKTREAMRAGLAMYFRTLDDPELLAVGERAVAALEIDHFFNVQLVGDLAIEVNPRISTVVYQEDPNLPYLGLKYALGELSDDELSAYRSRVRASRRALRWFDQVEWDD